MMNEGRRPARIAGHCDDAEPDVFEAPHCRCDWSVRERRYLGVWTCRGCGFLILRTLRR